MSNTSVNLKKDPRDFVQLTRGNMKDMRELSSKSLAAFQVLFLIAERMNKSNALVISQATLAEILGYSRNAINVAVKLLEKERWVQIIKIGQSNAYIANAQVVWRDASGKRYTSFNAQVVASESEQDRPIENWENVQLRHVPILGPSEEPIVGDEELPPPDQRDLLPPDRIEFPRRGHVDRETGEVLPSVVAPRVDKKKLAQLDKEISKADVVAAKKAATVTKRRAKLV